MRLTEKIREMLAGIWDESYWTIPIAGHPIIPERGQPTIRKRVRPEKDPLETVARDYFGPAGEARQSLEKGGR